MPPRLTVAIGDYPHTRALKSGEVASDLVALDFPEIKPINRAFAPMARERRFDVSEMAIATFLQAKAYGLGLTLLPVALAARFQEAALLCRADSDIRGPADLKGRRMGVRSYSQTTGLWLRGVLAEDYRVAPSDVDWIVFEGAHVAHYSDPAFVTRAAPGQDLMTMLRAGELDAAIVGNDVPADANLRTVFPDPAAAGEAFRRRHGFMPINHLVVVRTEIAEAQPEIAAELVRLFAASRARETAPKGAIGRSAIDPSISLALLWADAQGLLPRPLTPEEVWRNSPPGLG